MPQSMLTAGDVAAFSRLQLAAMQIVEGFCSGLHRSPHKGFSVEFKEHRAYSPGDDVRQIDWKLFGKTDRLFIREHEEETNLRCTLFVDCSGSMAYRGSRAAMSKHEYAVRCAAALSYLLVRQQDAAGLVTFDTEVRTVVPPRARPRHLHAIFKALEESRPVDETDIGQSLHKAAARLTGRGLVVVFSDLFGDVESLTSALARLRSQDHEVLLFQTLDPDEIDFPFQSWTEFRSLERADVRQAVDPAQARAAYLRRLADFRRELRQTCSRQRVTLTELSTDRPHADALAEFIVLRRRGR